VTERKKTEQALRDSVDEWSRTFDSISDMIFIQDKDFVIRKANASFFKAIKLRPEEVLGKKCHEVVHKAGRPWKNCPFVMTIKDGKPHTEEVDDPKMGVALLVTTFPIFNRSGKLSGSVHIARDISDAKKVNEELTKRSEDLERFNKLAVGRELKMIELKNRIKELEAKSSKD
jgi:PAS domain S-box-containing protein